MLNAEEFVNLPARLGTMPRRDGPHRDLTLAIGAVALPRILGGLTWITWGLLIYQAGFAVPGAYLAATLYVVAGVAAMGLAVLPLSARQRNLLDIALIGGTLLAFAFWVHTAVYQSPAYGTDEIALGQGGAERLLHVQNPYGADLGWSLDRYGVPPSYSSYTLSGQEVRTMTYPALSFLPYMPLLIAGIHAQAAVYVDALFWILGMLALWFALPRWVRPLVPLVASFSFYIQYVAGGVVDSLLLPFLIVALWRWDRFGDPTERTVARWIGPLALGLACATKQTAWFLAAFLLIGIALQARSGRLGVIWTTGRYAALCGCAFLAPNLPFILWNARAWLHGVMTPISSPLVPFGQGFVSLSLYLGLGGGFLQAYKLAAAAVALALAAALVVWFPALRRLLPLLPAVVLLFPTRSLSNYFLFAVPGLLVSASTVRPWHVEDAGRLTPLLRRTGIVLTIIGAGAGAGLTALAATAPAPLSMQIVGEHATGQLLTLDSLTLRVHNRSTHMLTPHFAATLGPYLSSPWIVHRGPARLGARQTATYVIWAPNIESMPGIDSGFEVYAFTTNPAAISTSGLYQPAANHLQITPEAVNQPVAVAKSIVLTVHVLDRLNQPILRAGIPVRLGQVVYAQEGLFPGETSINGQPEGRSPVVARTDANGLARFTIRAVQVQPYEVFFQAWLVDGYSQGYSNMVTVRFKPRGRDIDTG